MKMFISIVALGTLLAAPVFAQQVLNNNTRADWASRVHVYAPDYYMPRRDNNPHSDYQLGGYR